MGGCGPFPSSYQRRDNDQEVRGQKHRSSDNYDLPSRRDTTKLGRLSTIESLKWAGELLDRKAVERLAQSLEEISKTFGTLERRISELPVDTTAGGGNLKLIPLLAGLQDDFHEESEAVRNILKK